ncbi:hypothetical protein RXV95_10205 [Novosphingobium sp. ZN18A2]|uniref:DUF6932 family protein n=1 Tax=Novosphingobium sp. ZN18A2 TaxID=3079861 RepID=UPI0030CFFA4E
MIPGFNLNGVLPPFVGSTPGAPMAHSSPYECTPIEMVQRFSTTDHRKSLLRGFFRFRAALRAQGFGLGFQWVDGSFTEDVEAFGRDPGDIDVLTLSYRPDPYVADFAAWNAFVAGQRNGGIFDRNLNRTNFDCDTFFVDLHIPSHLVARQAAYWNGLFSHRRNSFQWKGMLAIALHIDDTDAIAALEGEGDE